MTAERRAAMGEAAVAAAKAVGYVGAGTVEVHCKPRWFFLFHGNEHAFAGGTPGYRNDYWYRFG